MKKQKTKQIITLDEFDNTVSLWQLLPSGVGSGLKRLKIIIDSIQNNQIEQSNKPLSLLLVGKQGLRTHARAFLRALGLGYPCETNANFLQSTSTEIYNYFNPTRLCDSYIISSVSLLYTPTLKTLYEIISDGRFSIFSNIRKATELIPVHNPIIMTTKNIKKIPEYFLEKIDHVVEIGDYTDQQLELVVLQRLKYSQVDYAEEKVLWLVKEYGSKNLHEIIRLLKDAITIMLSEDRTVLTVEDVKKVMSLS